MVTKKCYKCIEEKPIAGFNKDKTRKDGYSNLCRECNTKYKSKYRKIAIGKIRKYRKLNTNRMGIKRRLLYPTKCSAIDAVYYAVKTGKITKTPCEMCGSENNIHGHHEDYGKPLNVNWLCVSCHNLWHQLLKIWSNRPQRFRIKPAGSGCQYYSGVKFPTP